MVLVCVQVAADNSHCHLALPGTRDCCSCFLESMFCRLLETCVVRWGFVNHFNYLCHCATNSSRTNSRYFYISYTKMTLILWSVFCISRRNVGRYSPAGLEGSVFTAGVATPCHFASSLAVSAEHMYLH